ncbi:MAG: VWA domain-containing protein [Candidatus Pacearchaeota archaeon]
MHKKRGVFFSLDAIVALGIILTVIIIAFPQIQKNQNNTELPSDILTTLSSLKISDIDDPEIIQLISQGVLDGDRSVMEQIGILSIKNETLAKQIASLVLENLNTNENLGIWYGNKLIFSLNKTAYENSSNVLTERYIVSGLGGLNSTSSVDGYSARGFLSGTYQTSYEYFGGYVGDGNISKTVSYSGTINSADIELAINKNFTVYINGNNAGTYAASTVETTPVKYSLNSYIQHFNSGNNLIELKGNNLYIAGGYIRITYDANASFQETNKTYLPGINGTVNLYDGIATEGQLDSMNIFLHYNIPYSSFLKIGNVTVWNNSAAGENTTILSNSYLSTVLSYNSLSNTTTPIRFGSENLSLNTNLSSGNADVILITDVSGSMDASLGGGTSVNRTCSDPLINDPSTKRISLAKCLDQEFVRTVLAGSNNRVGLVSFSGSSNNYVNLTNNISLLNTTITQYVVGGGTCVSCAINRAYLILQSLSNSSRNKYVIVMTDGATNTRSTSICYDSLAFASTQSGSSTSQVGRAGASAKYISVWSATSNPSTGNINNVDMLNDTFAFAVGDSYKIFQWNGATWTQNVDLGSTNIKGINFYNSTGAFAVGDSGKIARWSGSSWSEFTDTGNDNFKDVSMVNATLGFAVGDSGKIFRWNGATWTQFVDVGNENLKAIDMYNATFGLAGGSSTGQIYRWNGTAWPLELTLYPVGDLDIFNGTHTFMVSTNDNIYKRTGYVGAWSGAGYTASGDLLAVKIINSSLGFAAGDATGGIVVWNGTSWNNTYPDYYYNGNSTTGKDCADTESCNDYVTAPMLNANYSSCRIHDDLNATVHSIGFGPVATCGLSQRTLLAVANCGNGSYYASDNATQLSQIYQNLSQSILQLSYAEQTALVSGNSSGTLYPDSYIELNYKKKPKPFGLQITLEEQFQNTTSGTFSVYPNSSILSARATSYSGAKWTNKLILNGQKIAYDISNYGSSYIFLGDPYSLTLPLSSINITNNLSLNTGLSPSNTSIGSQYNKIIYVLNKNFSSFSPIVASAAGCNWYIEFDDGTNITTAIPSSYNGTNNCYYPPPPGLSSYDQNDAFQTATGLLLAQLDVDGDGKINPRFTEQALQIDLSQTTGIPFTWYTEVQIRVWT